jgi:hypothetical protein
VGRLSHREGSALMGFLVDWACGFPASVDGRAAGKMRGWSICLRLWAANATR